MATQTSALTKLEKLVDEFDQDTTAGRSRITELMEKDPRSFQEGVVRILKSSLDSGGAQFVINSLVTSDFLMPTLCDPGLTLQEAVSLGRIAMQTDPMMDVNLARKLADSVALGVPVSNADRLLNVLGEISPGDRIAGSLMRLLRRSDPALHSKAVLLIGRGNRSVKWVLSRLANADPRIRANAIEALWGVDTAEARSLLRVASRDSNNRVAGNALYALYRLGDTWVIPELFKMAASESPLTRSSAAWAMGEAGDPRFSEALRRMLSEPLGIVRKCALKGLSRLKAATDKTRQGREWRVAGRLLPSSGDLRRFLLEVDAMDGSPPPQLLPTQFILSLDGRPVNRYQVEAHTCSGLLAVTFLFPYMAESNGPSWQVGALACLTRKRAADLWRAMHYMPADATRQATPPAPEFTSSNEIAAAALQDPPAKTSCLPLWDSIIAAVEGDSAPPRAVRHVIVYNQSNLAAPAGLPEIISLAMASNISVQAVSSTPCPPLEELCRRTQGSFRLAQSEFDSCKLIEEACLNLLGRFLVSYQPDTSGGREINVRVFDPAGWGETTIPL